MRTAGPGVRVGTDLVAVSEVASSIEKFGNRYLDRVFSEHELATCTGAPEVRAARLAARFAAKEATIKVLEPEDQGLDWRSIEVRSAKSGAPRLALSGTPARLAARAGIGRLALSLTHDAGLAFAVVVALLETTETEEQR